MLVAVTTKNGARHPKVTDPVVLLNRKYQPGRGLEAGMLRKAVEEAL